ncbi:MAG: hypothetical protein IIY70_04295 [Oscillospiraceae bacterium]|nr:hypothetical protein [Oscillospiraceae bacterium]
MTNDQGTPASSIARCLLPGAYCPVRIMQHAFVFNQVLKLQLIFYLTFSVHSDTILRISQSKKEGLVSSYMKNKTRKYVLLGTALAMVAVIAWTIINTLPFYPAFEREVDTLSELRDILGRCDATKTMVVAEPPDFGSSSKHLYLRLDDRTLTANPAGYAISYTGADHAFCTIWDVIAEFATRNNTRFLETRYRGMPTQWSVSRDNKANDQTIYLRLLCGKFLYSIHGYFDTAGMTEQEITERETEVKNAFYAVADQIIDAAG